MAGPKVQSLAMAYLGRRFSFNRNFENFPIPRGDREGGKAEQHIGEDQVQQEKVAGRTEPIKRDFL